MHGRAVNLSVSTLLNEVFVDDPEDGVWHRWGFVALLVKRKCDCLARVVVGSLCAGVMCWLASMGLVPLTTVGFTRELWWCWWPLPVGGVLCPCCQ